MIVLADQKIVLNRVFFGVQVQSAIVAARVGQARARVIEDSHVVLQKESPEHNLHEIGRISNVVPIAGQEQAAAVIWLLDEVGLLAHLELCLLLAELDLQELSWRVAIGVTRETIVVSHAVAKIIIAEAVRANFVDLGIIFAVEAGEVGKILELGHHGLVHGFRQLNCVYIHIEASCHLLVRLDQALAVDLQLCELYLDARYVCVIQQNWNGNPLILRLIDCIRIKPAKPNYIFWIVITIVVVKIETDCRVAYYIFASKLVD